MKKSARGKEGSTGPFRAEAPFITLNKGLWCLELLTRVSTSTVYCHARVSSNTIYISRLDNNLKIVDSGTTRAEKAHKERHWLTF